MKTCARCGETKIANSFYKNSRMADGRLGICAVCVQVRQRAYVAKNKPAIAATMRAYHAANRPKLLAQQRLYKSNNRVRLAELRREKATGFSPALFAATLAHQNNRCPICLVAFEGPEQPIKHADHCHESGAPRGVLCQTCNTGLGKLGDCLPQLLRAVEYLKRPPAQAMKQKGYE